MLVPIPVPKGAACTASASVMKRGQCAACACDFVYIIECSARGEGSSFLYGLSAAANAEAEEEAQQQARAELERQMATRTRDVACPACGRIPSGAVTRARLLRLFPFVAIAVVLAALILQGKVEPDIAPVVWGIAALLVVVGACVAALYRSRRAPLQEPRDVTSLSIALSRGRAVRLEVFDAIMSRKSAEPRAASVAPDSSMT